MSQATSVLILGGGRAAAARLRRSLVRHFLMVETAADVAQARQVAERCSIQRLVLLHPSGSWDTLQAMLLGCDWLPPGIVLVAERDRADLAIDALRGGVSEVLLRPFPIAALVAALAAPAPHRLPRQAIHSGALGNTLIGDSSAIREVRQTIRRVAPTAAAVLIEGESGTGKELVARLLHARSGRSGPFVPLDCSLVEARNVAAELFGRTASGKVRGGLLAAARGGTLFLENVDRLRARTGAMLARTLEHGTYRPQDARDRIAADCRLIAATRENLGELVTQRRFRDDLYHLLSVVRIALPPLRQRRDDIALLARHFATAFAASTGTAPVPLEGQSLDALTRRDWPGNVRELRAAVERTLSLGVGVDGPADATAARATPDYPLDWTLAQVKQHHMQKVLEASGGNKAAAARRLGVSRRTLERKLGAAQRQ